MGSAILTVGFRSINIDSPTKADRAFLRAHLKREWKLLQGQRTAPISDFTRMYLYFGVLGEIAFQEHADQFLKLKTA